MEIVQHCFNDVLPSLKLNEEIPVANTQYSFKTQDFITISDLREWVLDDLNSFCKPKLAFSFSLNPVWRRNITITPLSLACLCDNIELVQFFAQSTTFFTTNKPPPAQGFFGSARHSGQDPYISACASGNPEILKLLRRHHGNKPLGELEGGKLLRTAIGCGHLEFVEYFLAEAETEKMDPPIWTPDTPFAFCALGLACHEDNKNRKRMVEALLAKGATIDRSNVPGIPITVMPFCSALRDDLEILQLLFDTMRTQQAQQSSQHETTTTTTKGEDCVSRMLNFDYTGTTLLRVLYTQGNFGFGRETRKTNGPSPKLWNFLFDNGLNVNKIAFNGLAETNPKGERLSLLHLAIQANDLEVVDMLISRADKDVDINILSAPKGYTPLSIAALSNGAVVEKLLSLKGVAVNGVPIKSSENEEGVGPADQSQLRDVSASIPLCAAATMPCNTTVGHILLRHPEVDIEGGLSPLSPLHIAASNGYIEFVSLLLEKGASVNGKTPGNSPLLAATKGKGGFHRAVIEKLIELGADVTICAEPNHATVLHYAAGTCVREIVDLLISKGAPIHRLATHVEGDREILPLNVAIEAGNADPIPSLFGNLLDTLSEERVIEILMPSVFKAAENGNSFVLEVVLNKIPRILKARREFDGATPLIIAASAGTLCVETFLAKGADPRDVDNEGNTALHLAGI